MRSVNRRGEIQEEKLRNKTKEFLPVKNNDEKIKPITISINLK